MRVQVLRSYMTHSSRVPVFCKQADEIYFTMTSNEYLTGLTCRTITSDLFQHVPRVREKRDVTVLCKATTLRTVFVLCFILQLATPPPPPHQKKKKNPLSVFLFCFLFFSFLFFLLALGVSNTLLRVGPQNVHAALR